MLNEKWMKILKEQILADEDKKRRMVKAAGYTGSIYCKECCMLEKGVIIEVETKVSSATNMGEEHKKKILLQVLKKYNKFVLFENLSAAAGNRTVSFSYWEVDNILAGKYIPEIA